MNLYRASQETGQLTLFVQLPDGMSGLTEGPGTLLYGLSVEKDSADADRAVIRSVDPVSGEIRVVHRSAAIGAAGAMAFGKASDALNKAYLIEKTSGRLWTLTKTNADDWKSSSPAASESSDPTENPVLSSVEAIAVNGETLYAVQGGKLYNMPLSGANVGRSMLNPPTLRYAAGVAGEPGAVKGMAFVGEGGTAKLYGWTARGLHSIALTGIMTRISSGSAATLDSKIESLAFTDVAEDEFIDPGKSGSVRIDRAFSGGALPNDHPETERTDCRVQGMEYSFDGPPDLGGAEFEKWIAEVKPKEPANSAWISHDLTDARTRSGEWPYRLEPGKTYNMRVTAETEKGKGEESDESEFKTWDYPGVPEEIEIAAISDGSLYFHWKDERTGGVSLAGGGATTETEISWDGGPGATGSVKIDSATLTDATRLAALKSQVDNPGRGATREFWHLYPSITTYFDDSSTRATRGVDLSLPSTHIWRRSVPAPEPSRGSARQPAWGEWEWMGQTFKPLYESFISRNRNRNYRIGWEVCFSLRATRSKPTSELPPRTWGWRSSGGRFGRGEPVGSEIFHDSWPSANNNYKPFTHAWARQVPISGDGYSRGHRFPGDPEWEWIGIIDQVTQHGNTQTNEYKYRSTDSEDVPPLPLDSFVYGRNYIVGEAPNEADYTGNPSILTRELPYRHAFRRMRASSADAWGSWFYVGVVGLFEYDLDGQTYYVNRHSQSFAFRGSSRIDGSDIPPPTEADLVNPTAPWHRRMQDVPDGPYVFRASRLRGDGGNTGRFRPGQANATGIHLIRLDGRIDRRFDQTRYLRAALPTNDGYDYAYSNRPTFSMPTSALPDPDWAFATTAPREERTAACDVTLNDRITSDYADDSTIHVIEGLDKARTYSVRASIRNELGWGRKSAAVMARPDSCSLLPASVPTAAPPAPLSVDVDELDFPPVSVSGERSRASVMVRVETGDPNAVPTARATRYELEFAKTMDGFGTTENGLPFGNSDAASIPATSYGDLSGFYGPRDRCGVKGVEAWFGDNPVHMDLSGTRNVCVRARAVAEVANWQKPVGGGAEPTAVFRSAWCAPACLATPEDPDRGLEGVRLSAPSALSMAVGPSNTSGTLSFDAPNPADQVKEYEVGLADGSGEPTFTKHPTATIDGGRRSLTIAGLHIGTEHSVSVKAFAKDDGGYEDSARSPELRFATGGIHPSAKTLSKARVVTILETFEADRTSRTPSTLADLAAFPQFIGDGRSVYNTASLRHASADLIGFEADAEGTENADIIVKATPSGGTEQTIRVNGAKRALWDSGIAVVNDFASALTHSAVLQLVEANGRLSRTAAISFRGPNRPDPPTITSVELDSGTGRFKVDYAPDADQIQWFNDDVRALAPGAAAPLVSRNWNARETSGPFSGVLDGSGARSPESVQTFTREGLAGNRIAFWVQTQNRVGYSRPSDRYVWDLGEPEATVESDNLVMAIASPPVSTLQGFSVRSGRVHLMGAGSGGGLSLMRAPILADPNEAPSFSAMRVGMYRGEDPEDWGSAPLRSNLGGLEMVSDGSFLCMLPATRGRNNAAEWHVILFGETAAPIFLVGRTLNYDGNLPGNTLFRSIKGFWARGASTADVLFQHEQYAKPLIYVSVPLPGGLTLDQVDEPSRLKRLEVLPRFTSSNNQTACVHGGMLHWIHPDGNVRRKPIGQAPNETYGEIVLTPPAGETAIELSANESAPNAGVHAITSDSSGTWRVRRVSV